MMKLNYVLLLVSMLLLSCTENEETTSQNCTENPLENIDWLSELVRNEALINRVGSIRITQYTFNNQIAFLIDDCIGEGCITNQATLFDCDQNILCEFGGIDQATTCPNFETEATNPVQLFPELRNSLCDKDVIINNTLFNTIEASSIVSAEITGDCLSLSFFHAPECSDRIENVALIDAGFVLESFPIQRNLKFNISPFQQPTESQNLLCDALSLSTTSFDISSLSEGYEEVILTIEGLPESVVYRTTP